MSRFINHSYEATASQSPHYDKAYLVANCDIEKGEELTQNYLEFESPEGIAEKGILPQDERK